MKLSGYSTRFEIIEKSLIKLESEDLPRDIINKMRTYQDIEFIGEEEFVDILNRTIGTEQTRKYRSKIFKHSKSTIRSILKKAGLLNIVRFFWRLIMVLINSKNRTVAIYKIQRFLKFSRKYKNVLRYKLYSEDLINKKALLYSSYFPRIEAELGLIKALELAGFLPVVLLPSKDIIKRGYYKLAGVNQIFSLDDFSDSPDYDTAKSIVQSSQSIQDLLKYEYDGVRVGLFAISTTVRDLRLGISLLDLKSPFYRRILIDNIASSITAAKLAEGIIKEVSPELLFYLDGAYTPEGELVDKSLINGIYAINWKAGHKSNSLLFKRFTLENRDEHVWSLSSDSWRPIRDMKWNNSHSDRLKRELYDGYVSGDWYGNEGIQFNKHLVTAEEIRKRLRLDPSKKTAFIFPHILWDASLFWAKTLFRSYEEWLIKTIKMAYINAQVNWVIKIHPAHVGKGILDNCQVEPIEEMIIRDNFSELPPHVSIIPAASDISTFSLFELMDYCVTVHGTIGIEAACLGIPVITAAIGRYSHKGFTVDSDSCEQYLEKIRKIHTIPRLSNRQRELAERFAYGIFVLRPFLLSSFTLEYFKDYQQMNVDGNSRTQFNIKTKEDWYNASDLKAFAKWVNDSNQIDFLNPLNEN